MPYYDIVGKGIKTSRKRHMRYLADNEDHAVSMANKDETEVITIEMVEAGPATEKQKQYARDLGLSFPDDINVYEMSNLLNCKLDNDSASPKWLIEHVWEIEPSQKGLAFTKYAGLEELVSFIYSKYFNDKNKTEMVHWFLYFVVRDRLNIGWDKPITEIYSDYPLDSVELRLTKNENVINSIKRYTNLCLLRFGEYLDEEGFTVTGGSKRTASYKEAMSLLKEAGIISIREKISYQASNVSKSNSGCLNVLLIVSVLPAALYVLW